jgi:hypothetical protein
MPSSVIRRFRYDERRRRLTVTFVSGEIYAYENVPPEVTEDFRARRRRAGSSAPTSATGIHTSA